MASVTTHDTAPSSQIIPAFCLIGVVALLSSITQTMKYVLQHSSLTFLSIANGRIVIGFLFLAAVTACFDGKGLRSLGIADSVRFGLLGLLGVGSYVVAAYGLLYTNVTHYALIYSLLPTFPPFSAGAFPKIACQAPVSLASYCPGEAVFIPICTIGIAHLSLGEPLTGQTLVGASAVLLGTELVRRKPALAHQPARQPRWEASDAAGKRS